MSAPVNRRIDRRPRDRYRFEALEGRRCMDAGGLGWPDPANAGEEQEPFAGDFFNFAGGNEAPFSPFAEPLTFDFPAGSGEGSESWTGSGEFFVIPSFDGPTPGSGELDVFTPIDFLPGGVNEIAPAETALPINPSPGDFPSGSSLAVTSTSPADGDRVGRVTDGPTIIFDRPLQPGALPFGNLQLERLGSGGVWQVIVADSIEELDFTGTRLTLPIPESLAVGTYRLSLSPNAFLVADDGSIVSGDGMARILSTFEVTGSNADDDNVPGGSGAQHHGPILADALPLGVIGSETSIVRGQLDPGTPASAVRLYRLELSSGHRWRLGLEVASEREGSSLDTQLALYDSNGSLVKTADIGRSDAPADPFLFEGLDEGIYYVAVAPAGLNLSRGGYDPTTGRLGRLPTDRPGGAFTLHAVADPADAATRVIGFGIDRADPSDPRPTGFTIRFGAPVTWLSHGNASDGNSGGPVEVVAENGQVVGLAVRGYDESTATLSLLLREPIGLGQYSLRVAAGGGLSDLSGAEPAADGLPPGTLARFAVTTTASTMDPDNLGALLPTPALLGYERHWSLGDGESRTLRFVVAFEGFYSLSINAPEDLAYLLSGPEGSPALRDDLDPTQPNGATLRLKPGEYFLTIRNVGSWPAEATIELRSLSTLFDSILPNGVGSGPGLGLRLVAPPVLPGGTTLDTSTTPYGSGNTIQGPEKLQALPAAGDQQELDSTTGATTGAGVPLLTSAVDLLGRPTESSPRVAAVTVPGAIAATAALSDATAAAVTFGQSIGDGLDTNGGGYAADGAGSDSGRSPSPIHSREIISPLAHRVPGKMQDSGGSAASVSTTEQGGSMTDALAPIDPAVAAAAFLAANEPESAEEQVGESRVTEEPKLGIGVALASAWLFGRRVRRRRRRGAMPTVRAIAPPAPGPGGNEPFPSRPGHWSFKLTR